VLSRLGRKTSTNKSNSSGDGDHQTTLPPKNTAAPARDASKERAQGGGGYGYASFARGNGSSQAAGKSREPVRATHVGGSVDAHNWHQRMQSAYGATHGGGNHQWETSGEVHSFDVNATRTNADPDPFSSSSSPGNAPPSHRASSNGGANPPSSHTPHLHNRKPGTTFKFDTRSTHNQKPRASYTRPRTAPSPSKHTHTRRHPANVDLRVQGVRKMSPMQKAARFNRKGLSSAGGARERERERHKERESVFNADANLFKQVRVVCI
jgi:hypothetical protein